MPKQFVLLSILPLILSTSAFAQNVNDLLSMFDGVMRQSMRQAALSEWRRLSPSEISCLDQRLQQQGGSVDTLINRGVPPSDPRLSQFRFACRTSKAPVTSARSMGDVDIENLSSKPTFDCSRAKALTARVVCFDQAGAAADWDLISAYWALYFSIPENGRQAFDQARTKHA